MLPVIVQLPAEKLAAGRVRQAAKGALVVPDGDVGRSFAALFDGSRIAVVPSPDFVSQAWWKLVINAALGGVCALAVRDSSLAQQPEVQELILAVMREVIAVGRAEGAELPDDAPEKAIALVIRGAPGHWSSIALDRREGRPMEWRARNAVVGQTARRHGIATPLNDAITTLLRAIDES